VHPRRSTTRDAPPTRSCQALGHGSLAVHAPSWLRTHPTLGRAPHSVAGRVGVHTHHSVVPLAWSGSKGWLRTPQLASVLVPMGSNVLGAVARSTTRPRLRRDAPRTTCNAPPTRSCQTRSLVTGRARTLLAAHTPHTRGGVTGMARTRCRVHGRAPPATHHDAPRTRCRVHGRAPPATHHAPGVKCTGAHHLRRTTHQVSSHGRAPPATHHARVECTGAHHHARVECMGAHHPQRTTHQTRCRGHGRAPPATHHAPPAMRPPLGHGLLAVHTPSWLRTHPTLGRATHSVAGRVQQLNVELKFFFKKLEYPVYIV